MLSCPFCGASETDRFELAGHRYLVFACMFTPEVDAHLSDEELSRHLGETFGADGQGYFRRMCDRLHLYVADGPGARHLRAGGDARASEPPAR